MGRLLYGALAGSISLTAMAGTANPGSRSPDPGLVQAGRALYAQRCASCHGAHGEGAPGWQHRDAQGELPPPPHDSTGHTWKHSDAMLYRLVRQGWRDPFNKTQRLTMPAFEGILSPHEVRAVISYLKTLWTPQERRFQREESRHHPFPPEAR